MDLPEHDQRHREVVEQAEPAIEVDRRLRRLDAFGLAAVGQRAVRHREVGVQVRLEGEIADLARDLEPAQAGLDAALRVERAVEHAEVGVAAAGRLQQIARLGQADALLDLADRFGEPTRSRQRDAEGVEGLHAHRDGLALARRSRDEARLVAGRGERALGPGDRRCVVAGPKRQPAHFLEQVRALDRIAAGPRRSRPDSKQARARSRSPDSQCSEPILRRKRAPATASPAAPNSPCIGS